MALARIISFQKLMLSRCFFWRFNLNVAIKTNSVRNCLGDDLVRRYRENMLVADSLQRFGDFLLQFRVIFTA